MEQQTPAADIPLNIHTDLNQCVVVDTHAMDWVASPQPGVVRKMLERDGGELARATSVVRYAPGSSFAAHEHGAGEEFFVLDGVFADEHGEYSAGTYVRNPPGSGHAPFSKDGCTILVKLRQIPAGERSRLVVDTNTTPWRPSPIAGVERMPLFDAPVNAPVDGPVDATADPPETAGERVYLVRFAPGVAIGVDVHSGGEEVFVLSGVVEDEAGAYPQGTWFRSPDQSTHCPYSREGCTLWVKRGHLRG